MHDTQHTELTSLASERQYLPFSEWAMHEDDAFMRSDLLLTSDIATELASQGSLALVVGGFARDAAIARHTGEPQSSKDIDVEVYGMKIADLLRVLSGYGRVETVGMSFGVIKVINPESGQALDFSIPRTDSKSGNGHKGFTVTGNPNLSVLEAAKRRDLTINSLALNPLTGEMIDEFGGLADIKSGILRATDPETFAEDPLRVLRVMQFAGRFGYTVDTATAELCRSIDVTELPAERIGEEWVKLMTKSPRPSVGLEVARQLGVLDKLHPQLAVLDKIAQEPEWHPEGNVWEHTKLAADVAARVVREEQLTGDEALVVVFAALCHDLGKATTTELREKHGVMRLTAYGHEAAGVEPTKEFLRAINMKNSVIDTVLPIVREHLYHVHNPNPTDEQMRKFAGRLKPANIRLWNMVSRCDSNGRGQEFQPRTASHDIFERSLTLQVAEKPAEPIVLGRHLIELLGMRPGPGFKGPLSVLYEAQLTGAFETPDGGILYLRSHHAELIVATE